MAGSAQRVRRENEQKKNRVNAASGKCTMVDVCWRRHALSVESAGATATSETEGAATLCPEQSGRVLVRVFIVLVRAFVAVARASVAGTAGL